MTMAEQRSLPSVDEPESVQRQEESNAERDSDSPLPEVCEKPSVPPVEDRQTLPVVEDVAEIVGGDEGARDVEMETEVVPESIEIVEPHDVVVDAVEELKSPTSIQPPSERPVDVSQPSSPTSEHPSTTHPTSSLTTTVPSTSVRTRSDSRSTTATRSMPLSSTVFVIAALEKLNGSKEAKKDKEFGDAIQKALDMIKQTEPQRLDPEILFLPLLLASRCYNQDLQNEALDCLGKLISYSYFSLPSAQREAAPEQAKETEEEAPLIERAIEAICDCFENEATPVKVEQQIIKSLLAAVLNDRIIVHGAGLLKAVRQIYNIFIYSRSPTNQQVAQASLTQMVETVFDRVKSRIAVREARIQLSKPDLEINSSEDNLNGSSDTNGTSEADGSSEAASTTASEQASKKEPGEKLTLQSFENSQNFNDGAIHDNAPTTVTRARENQRARNRRQSLSVTVEQVDSEFSNEDEEDEIYIKDAFLIFRSFCKLSHKVLSPEHLQDLKSQNMRSKLLSLHLIHLCLNNYTSVFGSPFVTLRSSNNSSEPMSFIQGAKPHLCLSLSRNGSSSVPQVYEVCCEIFWVLLKNLRVSLKKELEVFLKEIYLSILERKNAPAFQKQYFMSVLRRLSGDPRALVELYLNYDCDGTALANIFQGVIEHLSRICSTPVFVTAIQQQQYIEQHQRANETSEREYSGTHLPNFTTASPHHPSSHPPPVPIEYALKQDALECLVGTLRSLDSWSRPSIVENDDSRDVLSRPSFDDTRESLDGSNHVSEHSPHPVLSETPTNPSTPLAEDDPAQLEKAKQRKTALANGIRLFNFKPKRGISQLLADGFIHSDTPEDIAVFLRSSDRLDKAMLGEYLGEGENKNVAIMHAFVDTMDFAKRRFVDSLRQFLQSFRLPGEAQKIDRFMLKFAERYMAGNPNAFANADTAYVLAYSVILLNTDQHSSQMKGKRMTKEDFIKNNRGINDNANLPDEYLSGIYEEIAQHEIVLNTERENAAALGLVAHPSPGLASRASQALATVGRDLQREMYLQASKEMANKTEQLYRSLIRAQRRTASKNTLSKFIPATSFKHVGPMFEVTWMSFFSGLSGQVQDTQNIETIKLCMEGMKLAIRISCLFDLEMPRTAFVSALSKFTNLGNPREMVSKNVEALRALLEIAATEGNLLKGSWRDILTCISQLDRFQLLVQGVDETSIPDVSKVRLPTPPTRQDSSSSRKSLPIRRPRPRSTMGPASFQSDIAQESKSTEMVKGVDWIFTNTANLSSEAIIDFIRALSEVSWQEIQSSGNNETPRMYSLQKLVEISYYNMTRVKIEWTKIWDVLGEHFNLVGCHTNTHIVFFALDSLRQLSKQFMELEELPGFKFQKDFLKPFEHVMANSTVVTVKDMVLRCLHQLVEARGQNIRSGWKTMFGVFTIAAREEYEGIVSLAYDHVMQIYNTRFGMVISQGAFADLIVCLTEFSKNLKFQKKALQAIEILRGTVHTMLNTPECPLSHRKNSIAEALNNGGLPLNTQTQEEQYWFPILFAFHDILMTGDDLEVRGRALAHLFEILKQYGGGFPPEFWDTLWRQLLYPIFMVLRSKSEMSKVQNHEELSVWLSTTMVQALREMITLFTYFYDSLEYMLDRFLELLTLCICQENDTIARIGSNCLQQLILNNVDKFELRHWSQIVSAFVTLFERTTAHQLFTAAQPTPPGPPRTHSDAASINSVNSTNDTLPDKGSEDDNLLTPTVENPLRINGLHSPEPPDTSENGEGDSTPKPGSRRASTASTVAAVAARLEDYRPQHPELQQQPVVVTVARRRFFNKIITKCVLQLLMIETVQELFSNDAVYSRIPSSELLRLMGLLKNSYVFAKKFNDDRDLRQRLFLQGFMKQAPNLLKQESGSAATYVNILLRMYHDEGEERKASRNQTEAALIPLCVEIIRGYIMLDEEKQPRNIAAWRPVVVDVLEGYTNFPKAGFDKHVENFYPLGVELLSKDLGVDVRFALQGMLRRIGEVRMGMAPLLTPSMTPSSPRSMSSGYPFSRRASRSK